MKNKPLILEEAEYLNYKPKKPLGSGDMGVIYPYNRNNVIKFWDEMLSKETLDYYKENIKLLLNYKSHLLITAKQLVIMKNEIIGYILPYFKGVNLKDISQNTRIRLLIASMHNLEKEIIKFSQQHFLLQDIHNKNIMYFEGKLTAKSICTDCDSWEKDENKSFLNCYKHNIIELNTVFLDTIVKQSSNRTNIIEFIKNNKDLKERLTIKSQ